MIAIEGAVSDSSLAEGPRHTLGGHRTAAAPGSARREGGSSWARACVVVSTGRERPDKQVWKALGQRHCLSLSGTWPEVIRPGDSVGNVRAPGGRWWGAGSRLVGLCLKRTLWVSRFLSIGTGWPWGGQSVPAGPTRPQMSEYRQFKKAWLI